MADEHSPSIVVRLSGSLEEHCMANPCGDATLCGVAVETNWVTKLRQETPLKRPKEKVAVLGH